jgi:hypothetical protein
MDRRRGKLQLGDRTKELDISMKDKVRNKIRTFFLETVASISADGNSSSEEKHGYHTGLSLVPCT